MTTGHAKFQKKYNQVMAQLIETFNNCMAELKADFEKQAKDLHAINSKVMANHALLTNFHDESAQVLRKEKEEVANER